MMRVLLSLALAFFVGLAAAYADDAAKPKKDCGAKSAAKPCKKACPKAAEKKMVITVRGGQGGTLTPYQGRAYYLLPGYWSLRSQSVQKELKLTDKQKEKLKQISTKYYEQMRKGRQQDWAKFRKLSAEKRKQKYAQIAEKQKQRTAAVGKQIEQVLRPGQLHALKRIELRTRGAAALRNPRVVEQLNLSEKQKEKLRRNRQQLTEKMQRLQRKSARKDLDLLTPEQFEKLEKLHAKGYRTIGPQPRSK